MAEQPPKSSSQIPPYPTQHSANSPPTPPSPPQSPYEFAENPPPPTSVTPQSPPNNPPPAERNCPNCGFKIIGKTTRGRCPECAAPLDSGSAELLQYANSAWIRLLSLGALFLALALVTHVGGSIIYFYSSPQIGQFLQVIGASFTILGAWLLTRPEPFTEVSFSSILARWLPISLPPLWLLIYFLTLSQSHHSILLLTLTALTLSAASCLALAFFLRHLSMRIPSDYLNLQFINLAWAMPALLALAVLFQLQLLDYKAYFANIFFCSFPFVGGLIGLILWATHTLLRLSVELWYAARAADSAEYRRTHPPTPPRSQKTPPIPS